SVEGDHPSWQLPESWAGYLVTDSVRLAPDGVWLSRRVAATLVGSYPTVSPLPRHLRRTCRSAVSFLFHFPSAFAASLARPSCPSVSGLPSTPRGSRGHPACTANASAAPA